ncbi:MAG: iron-containing alcohol dehydrogenase, partial [Micropruina sp.]|nr:iron-containing alcohol dehydrogenase [Micropruina sp.]
MSDILDRALAAATDTRRIVLGSDVLDRTGPVFAETVPGARATIVADETTWALAGEPVAESLAAAGVELAEPLVFPASPTVFADYDNTLRVREHLERTGARACSVGSGTLNDLT